MRTVAPVILDILLASSWPRARPAFWVPRACGILGSFHRVQEVVDQRPILSSILPYLTICLILRPVTRQWSSGRSSKKTFRRADGGKRPPGTGGKAKRSAPEMRTVPNYECRPVQTNKCFFLSRQQPGHRFAGRADALSHFLMSHRAMDAVLGGRRPCWQAIAPAAIGQACPAKNG